MHFRSTNQMWSLFTRPGLFDDGLCCQMTHADGKVNHN
jgi:hypothetical protein